MVHILDFPVGRGGGFVKWEKCKKKVELDMHHMDKKKREEREREKGGQRSMLIGILFVVINLLLNCGSEL